MTNLPRRNPTFTGRAKLLADLTEMLTEGRVAAVAVRGMGGIGKTQLALEYAYLQRQVGRYELIWWIRAESGLTLSTDLAAIAPVLDIDPDTDQDSTIRAVLTALRQRDKWLLVFDNAPNAAAVRDRLPPGDGHILITSRDAAWGGVAHTIALTPFTRPEAVAYMHERTGQSEPAAAEQLSAALGGLPLALAQAAAYLEQHGGLSLQAYLLLYRGQDHAARMLAADLDDYPHSVASTWLVHFRELEQRRPASLQLLRLCAFLDPDDIDLALLLSDPESLAGPFTGLLADAANDPAQAEEIIGTLARTSLITRIDGANRVHLHRVVAEVTRTQLAEDQPSQALHDMPVAMRKAWADHTVRVLHTLFPANPYEVATWPTCAALAAHANVAVDHASANVVSGTLAHRLGQYLYVRLEFDAATTALNRALNIYTEIYGPDHADVARVLIELQRVRHGRQLFPPQRYR